MRFLRCSSPLLISLLLIGCSTAPRNYKTVVDAAAAKDSEAVLAMLKKGHKIDETNEAGFTALHLAAMYGFSSMVELTVKNGANLNMRTKAGLTPLLTALYYKNDAVAVWLINNGADIDLAAQNGATPLDFAMIYDCPNARKLLESKHAKTMN